MHRICCAYVLLLLLLLLLLVLRTSIKWLKVQPDSPGEPVLFCGYCGQYVALVQAAWQTTVIC